MRKPYDKSIYENVDRISLLFYLKAGKKVLKSVTPNSLESRTEDLGLFASGADNVQISERASQFGSKTMLYHYKRSQYSAIKPEKGDSKIELVYMRVNNQ